MLDKFSNQICMNKSYESDSIYMDVPAELAAIGYRAIYKLEGRMIVRPSLVGGASGSELIFSGDSSGSTTETGKLYFKCKGDDHNLVLYYPDITITPGTYFYDFQITYTRGNIATGGNPVTQYGTTPETNTLRILQGRFIVTPAITR